MRHRYRARQARQWWRKYPRQQRAGTASPSPSPAGRAERPQARGASRCRHRPTARPRNRASGWRGECRKPRSNVRPHALSLQTRFDPRPRSRESRCAPTGSHGRCRQSPEAIVRRDPDAPRWCRCRVRPGAHRGSSRRHRPRAHRGGASARLPRARGSAARCPARSSSGRATGCAPPRRREIPAREDRR